MSIRFEYDLLIVLTLTFSLGFILHKFFSTTNWYQPKRERLLPFAIVYVPVALIYSFITDELPLRSFSFDPVLEAPQGPDLGPQSVNQEGLIAVGTYIATVAINILVWLFALGIIIRYFIRRMAMARAGKTDI